MPHRLFDLSGRIALVTGSSRGIGRAIAEGLAESGATVVINGTRQEGIDRAVHELGDAGYRVSGCRFNVQDTAGIQAGIADIENSVGPIDILVNNAGIQRRVPLLECPEETWDEVLDVNLSGVFRVSQAVARRMVPRQRGKIINICSLMSELGRNSISPYAASKGGVRMLTRNMCAEWAGQNIQVNGIGPGYFKTELNEALVKDRTFSEWVCHRTPASRWGDVDELKGAAIYLASDAASYVNGQIIYVDGGMSSVV